MPTFKHTGDNHSTLKDRHYLSKWSNASQYNAIIGLPKDDYLQSASRHLSVKPRAHEKIELLQLIVKRKYVYLYILPLKCNLV